MTTWRDVTSYSRGDTDRTPRVWEADFGICRVTAHRRHGCDGWFVSCRELNISRAMLAATSAEDAQREGLEYVRATVRKLGDAMGGG